MGWWCIIDSSLIESLEWYERQKVRNMKIKTLIKRRWRSEGVMAKRIASMRAWNDTEGKKITKDKKMKNLN